MMPKTPLPQGEDLVRRHRLSTRIWHWISAVLILLMLMSGLMIFNAHPRLYWGRYGANPDPAWLEIGARDGVGYLRVGQSEIATTGVLGLSAGRGPRPAKRAFPAWATLPTFFGLSEARHWHVGLAWFLGVGTLFFGIWSILNGHVRRVLLPHRSELSPRHIWRQICDHALLRRCCREEAAKYNILQKITYLGVSGGLIPLMVLTGLTMSPWVVSIAPWLLDIFGGRQSARSLHFIVAFSLVLFVVVHIVMLVVSGPANGLRSMVTGWFRLPREKAR